MRTLTTDSSWMYILMHINKNTHIAHTTNTTYCCTVQHMPTQNTRVPHKLHKAHTTHTYTIHTAHTQSDRRHTQHERTSHKQHTP